MIEPSVGRVVWFHPSTRSGQAGFSHHGTGPLAAIVAHVWNDRMVNLSVFDSNGTPHSQTSVPLLQEDDQAPEYGFYCEWMPYQKGQAAKVEAMQASAAAQAHHPKKPKHAAKSD